VPTDQARARGFKLYLAAGILAVLVVLFLSWSLRQLILPSVVGALSAYICRPLLREARRWGVPHKLGVLILVGAFILSVAVVVGRARAFLSDQDRILTLRVRVQYKANERFAEAKGSLPGWLVKEIDPVVAAMNGVFALDRSESRAFEDFIRREGEDDSRLIRYFRYHKKNVETVRAAGRSASRRSAPESTVAKEQEGRHSFVGQVLGVLSIWVVMPFVFVFLLFDQGQILKDIVAIVPNKYFEVTLVVIHRVDEALGAYLRGVTLECFLVGASFAVCLRLCGIDTPAALAIGAVAGASNAIPFLGPAIGLLAGAAYGLVVEEISPILPFMTTENLLVGILVTVAVVQGLDNAYFQPIVLGKAVDLHPLIVIFGVMGGSILFGMAGMLLAVPFIVVVKVVVSSLFRELRAYSLI